MTFQKLLYKGVTPIKQHLCVMYVCACMSDTDMEQSAASQTVTGEGRTGTSCVRTQDSIAAKHLE